MGNTEMAAVRRPLSLQRELNQKLVNHGTIVSGQWPTGLTAVIGGNDIAPLQNRLLNLNNVFAVAHPALNVRQ
jgi:hypothetical protein